MKQALPEHNNRAMEALSTRRQLGPQRLPSADFHDALKTSCEEPALVLKCDSA